MEGGDCIIDLEKLQFVDSFGLTCLLKIHREIISVGKRCIICSLQKNVKQMFSIFKIDHAFDISKDLITAKKTFETNT
jgi:anti-sigma B factor antagonist